MQAGLRAATGDYILFQDADLEYSPTDYPTLFFPVKNLNADIVMGSRFMVARYTRVQYFWHKIGNLILTQLFNILFNTTWPAPGSEDTKFGVTMGPEVGHAETEIYAGVQA